MKTSEETENFVSVDEEIETEIEIIEELEDDIIEDDYNDFQNETFIIENQEDPTHIRERVLVLMSLHRTETSIVSDLFNAHPEVFFSYEPLSLIHHGCESAHAAVAAQLAISNEFIPKSERHILDWLNAFASCHFDLTIKPIITHLKNKEQHVPGLFPYRYKSGVLCSGEFCAGKI